MDNQNHEGSFKKAIGPFSGISIVAGMVIGSGVAESVTLNVMITYASVFSI